MEKRRLYLSTDHPENFVDGVAIHATPKGDVISFVTSLEGGLTPEFPSIPREGVLRELDGYKRITDYFIEAMHKQFKSKFLEVKNLSPCLKEVYRLFDAIIEIAKEDGIKERWRKVRDLIILVLYEDTSYRFPLQFAAGKANLEKLKLNSDDAFWFKSRSQFEVK